LLYPWVYIAVFSAMNPLIFRWYVASPTLAYILAVLLGVWALLDALLSQRWPMLAVAVMGIVGAGFLGLTLNSWRLHPLHGPDRPAPKMAWNEIELEYKHVGEMLRTKYGVTDDTLVAAGDIGAVGYYSRARILDTVGLVTPELVEYYPVSEDLLGEDANYAVPVGIILDYQPAYFVIMRGYISGGLELDATFNAQYAPVEWFDTDYYGGAMIVYQRRADADAATGNDS